MQENSIKLDTTSDRLYTIRRFDLWMIKRSGNSRTVVVWRMDAHELGPAWCEVTVPEDGREQLAGDVVTAVRGPEWLVDEVLDVMNGGERIVPST